MSCAHAPNAFLANATTAAAKAGSATAGPTAAFAPRWKQRTRPQDTGASDDDATIPDVYLRTLVANRCRRPSSNMFWDARDAVDFAADYRGWRRYLDAVAKAGEILSPANYMSHESFDYAAELLAVTRGRRFFATRGGRIGLGPAATQVGDELVVLFYCPTPYLLRDDAGGRTRLLGEAYVHDLMYAQALDMLDRGEVIEKSWVIH